MDRLFGKRPAAAAPASSDPQPQQTVPGAFSVAGAGSARANGVYHLDATQKDVYRGAGAAAGMWLYTLKDSWFIGVAADSDDWYSVRGDGGPRPPTNGWDVVDEGEAPAPQVFAVSVSSSEL